MNSRGVLIFLGGGVVGGFKAISLRSIEHSKRLRILLRHIRRRKRKKKRRVRRILGS